MKKVIIISTIIFLSNSIVFSQNPEDLLPEENEIPGWVFDTDSLCKEGLANDGPSLYDVIDGGADKYIDHGFVAGAYKGYSDGNYIICVEVYDQGLNDSAFSVYRIMHDGVYEIINSLGDSARLDTSLDFNYEIEMVVDKYFIRILTKDTKEEECKQAAIDIARNIAGKVGIIENPDLQNLSFDKYTANILISHINGDYIFKIKGKTISTEKNKRPEAHIYNNKGQMIRNLTMQLSHATKEYRAIWDGKNHAGSKIGNGRYIVVVRSDKDLISKSFITDQ